MTSLFRKIFYKKKQKINENEDHVYNTEQFDDTFTILKKVLSFMHIEMTHNLSEFRSKWWSVFFWFEALNIVLAGVLEFLSIVALVKDAHSIEDAIKFFGMLPCFGFCNLSLMKSVKIWLNRRVICEKMYYELREMWPQGEVSEDVHHIVSSTMKQFRIVIKGYFWCCNLFIINFLTPTLFVTMKRYLGYDVSMMLTFEYYLPFDPFKPVIFEFMLLLQTWQAMVVICWNECWDMLFCTFLTHITLQFDLLAQRVRKLIYVPLDRKLVDSYPLAHFSKEFIRKEEEAVNTYNDRDWEIRHEKELIDIIKTHLTLFRWADDMEAMFSFGLLINFMYSSIIICFCGFCCVLIEKWNEVAYKSFLLTCIMETWLLCWYGQKLLDSSLGVAQALYECGWYNSSQKIKRAILVMLLRAQKGVHMTTYGFSIVSLESYSTIIKTSWSYFTLLLNFFSGVVVTENTDAT